MLGTPYTIKKRPVFYISNKQNASERPDFERKDTFTIGDF